MSKEERVSQVKVAGSDIRATYPAVWEECTRLQKMSGGTDRTSFDAIKIAPSERESFFKVFASDPFHLAIDSAFGAASHVLDTNKFCFLRGNDERGAKKVISTLSSLNTMEKLEDALKGFPDVKGWFEEHKGKWIHRPFDGVHTHIFTDSQSDLQKQVERILAITPLRAHFQQVHECKIAYHEGKIEIYGKQVIYQEHARRLAAAASSPRPPTLR